ISTRDWSSDVCSSDLLERDARVFAAYATDYQARHRRRSDRVSEALACLEAHPAWGSAPQPVRDQLRARLSEIGCGEATTLVLAKIGRASCRERGKSTA